MYEKKFNGWTNYETWVVALWFGNDAGSSSYWNEEAAECWRDALHSRRVCSGSFSRNEQAAILLVARIRRFLEEANPIGEASPFADLLGTAICRIDFHELANHLLDDAREMASEG